MYRFRTTPALILGSTATIALTGGALPAPVIAAEVRATVTDAPAPPKPDRPPHRHHFAPTTAAAALVPTTPLRFARAATEAIGATV